MSGLAEAYDMRIYASAERAVSVAPAPLVQPKGGPAQRTEEAPAFKTCICGAALTWAEWAALPILGYQDCGEYRLEYRNCPDPCGSTLAIEVGK